MKKLFLISLLALVFTMAWSQSKRQSFSFLAPIDSVNVILPGSPGGPGSIVIDFGGSDALNATIEFGIYLNESNDFSDIAPGGLTYPYTVNLTNCIDTICIIEFDNLPFQEVILKYVAGSVTAGIRFEGEVIYNK